MDKGNIEDAKILSKNDFLKRASLEYKRICEGWILLPLHVRSMSFEAMLEEWVKAKIEWTEETQNETSDKTDRLSPESLISMAIHHEYPEKFRLGYFTEYNKERRIAIKGIITEHKECRKKFKTYANQYSDTYVSKATFRNLTALCIDPISLVAEVCADSTTKKAKEAPRIRVTMTFESGDVEESFVFYSADYKHARECLSEITSRRNFEKRAKTV